MPPWTRVLCVVLNAFYSERLAAALAEHVDFVIAMTSAVSDERATDFVTRF